TVIVPLDGHSGTRPLVSYAAGTVGLADRCAPSATLPHGLSAEGGNIAKALLRGWGVVVTDYEGLSNPGTHTYLVAESEGHAVLDAGRAAQHMSETGAYGLTADSPVGIMGYSQGGQASAAAAELADDYAPELDIKGTVSGGVPADILESAEIQGSDANSAAMMLTAIGHDAAYPGLELDSYLNETGSHLADELKSACVAEAVALGQGHEFDELITENPLEYAGWQQRLADGDLGTRAPADPVYLFHGSNDDIVPYELGTGLRQDWCSAGANVTWHAYPGLDHLGTAALGTDSALHWLGERLAGEQPDGNCP